MASNRTRPRLHKSDQLPKADETLITLFGQVIDIFTSDVNADLCRIPEVQISIQKLCEKAPKTAKTIVAIIQDGIANSRGRKRKYAEDPSYRPPNPKKHRVSPLASISGGNPNFNETPGTPTKTRSERSSKPPPLPSDHPSQEGGRSDEEKGALPIGTLTMASEALATSSKVQSIASASSQSEELLPYDSPDSAPQKEPLSAILTPVSATKQMDHGSSPRTEEIQREQTPSLESIISVGQSTPTELFPKPHYIIDLIVEAIRTICHLSRHKEGVPSDVHIRVLQSLQQDQPQESAVYNSHWSDGSMWVQVLEIGQSRKDRDTIQNMLEYIGAWEWYDIQLELAKKTVTTKKNKPVRDRGAAMHVMDQIQDRWISGVGIVTLHDEPSFPSKSGPISITAKEKGLQRNRIKMQLNRGKRCAKLVKDLGVGILFDQNIWDYVKLSMEQLDTLVKDIQADIRHTKLLQILSPQLEQLVKTGSPDLHMFYKDLKEAELLSENDLCELQIRFALEGDPLPDGQLDAEIDCLIQDINTKVLDQTTFGRDDTIAINEGIEIPCSIFDRLRPRRWLDSWTINALMQLSDKPAYVRHGLSVPLDENSGDNHFQPIKQPLRRWAMEMAKFRKEAKKTSQDAVPLVFFCPINHKGQHFSLLEINERKQVIRHYDSMSETTTALRMSRLVEEQFSDLGFSYYEVPTPQQDDGWSCGIRTVWNSRHLSNNLSIETSNSNPERMVLQVVEGLIACVEGGAMTKYIRRRRSDRERRPVA